MFGSSILQSVVKNSALQVVLRMSENERKLAVTKSPPVRQLEWRATRRRSRSEPNHRK